MKDRSRSDIAAAILKSCKAGNLKTKIMYEVQLSYPQLVSYLNELIEGKLLDLDMKLKTYTITAKGRKYLEKFDIINSLINDKPK